MKTSQTETIEITSSAFADGGAIPRQYTGFGADMSPDLNIPQVHANAVSIAALMNDLDVPFIKNYNHWTIWNLPAISQIPENIPYGAVIESLGGAMQGTGYGKNGYRGPKPPTFIRSPHRYEFHVFVLDCTLDLEPSAGKKELLKAIAGHVLQHGVITGIWSNRDLD